MQRPQVFAADSEYGAFHPVKDAELRPAFATERDPRGELLPGAGIPCSNVWWVATGWHRSEGQDFTTYYEIRGLGDIAGCPIVTFAGFALDFQGSVDHRIDFTSAVVEPLTYHAGNLRLRISGGFRDKDYDDSYNWRVYFQVYAPVRAPAPR